jgi:chemotaxis protein histidine kinase CheA
MFINLHTLKGQSRSLGLSILSAAVHEAEEKIIAAVQVGSALDFAGAGHDLDHIAAAMEQYVDIFEKKLNHSVTKINLESFGLNTIKLRAYLESPRPGKRSQVIKTLLAANFCQDFGESLLDLRAALSILAKKLGKEEPEIFVDSPAIWLTPDGKALLSKIMPHLIGNSMDHGIEKAEDRIQKGKTPHGTLSFVVKPGSDSLLLAYFDDGNGLNLSAIFKKAVEKGLLAADSKASPEEIAGQIFSPGFSTAASVSLVSGRGVGMDAVKSTIEEAGGNLKVELGTANSGSVPFKIMMTLPRQLFVMRRDKPETGASRSA